VGAGWDGLGDGVGAGWKCVGADKISQIPAGAGRGQTKFQLVQDSN